MQVLACPLAVICARAMLILPSDVAWPSCFYYPFPQLSPGSLARYMHDLSLFSSHSSNDKVPTDAPTLTDRPDGKLQLASLISSTKQGCIKECDMAALL